MIDDNEEIYHGLWFLPEGRGQDTGQFNRSEFYVRAAFN